MAQRSLGARYAREASTVQPSSSVDHLTVVSCRPSTNRPSNHRRPSTVIVVVLSVVHCPSVHCRPSTDRSSLSVNRPSIIVCRPSSVVVGRSSTIHRRPSSSVVCPTSLSVVRPSSLSIIRPSSLSVVCRPSSFVIRPSSSVVSRGRGVCTLDATQLASGKPRGRRGNVVSTRLCTCATPLGLPAWLRTPMRSQSMHAGVGAREREGALPWPVQARGATTSGSRMRGNKLATS